MRIGLEDTLFRHGEALFAELGEVVPLRETNVDACVVRAVNKVDKGFLLERPQLRYLASATSGEDHLDRAALDAATIETFVARGCNAEAVADWVVLACEQLSVRPEKLGIVGAGHVGKAVEGRFDCQVMLCDPPRAIAEPSFVSASIEEVFRECDVVTLHVPLNATTVDMVGHELLALLGQGVLLNAARGEVLQTEAAVGFAENGGRLVLDVFRNEPSPDRALLKATAFATPHIAGHTFQAKNAGIEMCARWLGAQNGKPSTRGGAYRSDGRSPRKVLSETSTALRRGADFKTLRAGAVRVALSRAGQGERPEHPA